NFSGTFIRAVKLVLVEVDTNPLGQLCPAIADCPLEDDVPPTQQFVLGQITSRFQFSFTAPLMLSLVRVISDMGKVNVPSKVYSERPCISSISIACLLVAAAFSHRTFFSSSVLLGLNMAIPRLSTMLA